MVKQWSWNLLHLLHHWSKPTQASSVLSLWSYDTSIASQIISVLWLMKEEFKQTAEIKIMHRSHCECASVSGKQPCIFLLSTGTEWRLKLVIALWLNSANLILHISLLKCLWAISFTACHLNNSDVKKTWHGNFLVCFSPWSTDMWAFHCTAALGNANWNKMQQGPCHLCILSYNSIRLWFVPIPVVRKQSEKN